MDLPVDKHDVDFLCRAHTYLFVILFNDLFQMAWDQYVHLQCISYLRCAEWPYVMPFVSSDKWSRTLVKIYGGPL